MIGIRDFINLHEDKKRCIIRLHLTSYIYISRTVPQMTVLLYTDDSRFHERLQRTYCKDRQGLCAIWSMKLNLRVVVVLGFFFFFF